MAKYARGRHAILIDDRSGYKIRYKDARTEWNGFRVYKGDWEAKQPQLEPGMYIGGGDPSVLFQPRPPQTTSDTIVRLGPLFGKWSGQCSGILNSGGITHGTGEEAIGMQANTSLGATSIAIVLPIPSENYQILNTALGSVVLNVDEEASLPALTATLNSSGVVIANIVFPTLPAASMNYTPSVVIGPTEDASLPQLTSTLGTVGLGAKFEVTASTLGQLTSQEGSPGLGFNAVEIPPSMAVTVTLGSITLNIPGFGTSEWGEDKWGQ